MMKAVGRIEDPTAFFASFGLHDVRIASLHIDVDGEALRIAVDDLYWNLEGMDEYPGEFPCILLFSGVDALRVDVELWDGIRISDHEIAPSMLKPDCLRLDLDLNIGGGESSKGRRSIGFTFRALSIESRFESAAPPPSPPPKTREG
jgi:hypothetical protein